MASSGSRPASREGSHAPREADMTLRREAKLGVPGLTSAGALQIIFRAYAGKVYQ